MIRTLIMRGLAPLLIALAFLPAPAHAWGAYGHRTIAALAEANLTPTAQRRMNALFAAEALIGTPQCALSDAGDASVWADCVRRDGLRWGYSAPWHYQGHDICQPFDPDTACANGNCVSAQVDRNAQLLADTSLPAHVRLEALAWLIHFVGDMHMPLHSGSRDDLGGNRVSANYGIVGGWMNLHGLWDSALAERAISEEPDLVRRYSAEEMASISAGTTADWQREAFILSRDLIYPSAQEHEACGLPVPQGTRAQIDNDEIRAQAPVARGQIRRAGLRLAHLLNEALG